MSFSHNPFLHLELIWDEEKKMWYWYCHGCGKENKEHLSTDLKALQESFHHHIRENHNRKPEDFEGWSKI